MAILEHDTEITLTEDEIGNHFQDTSSEGELETEGLKVNPCKMENPLCRNLLTLCRLTYMIKRMHIFQFKLWELILLLCMIQVPT